MAQCAICNKSASSGLIVDAECLENLKKPVAGEVAQFLQDIGYEDASVAVDAEYEL